MTRNSFLVTLGLALFASSSLCQAQNQQPPSFESAISVVRAGIQANKTATVGQVMDLDDKQAAAFWPIYRRYEYDRSKLDDARVDIIKQYTEKFPDLQDDEAKSLAERMFAYESGIAALKKRYYKEFNKVLPALKVTQFFQLERRIDLMIDMKVESTLPPLTQLQNVPETQ
jgi:hypothetical protein